MMIIMMMIMMIMMMMMMMMMIHHHHHHHHHLLVQDHRILVRTYFRLELPGMINTFHISHEHPFNIPHFT
jgi:hypothetical protein